MTQPPLFEDQTPPVPAHRRDFLVGLLAGWRFGAEKPSKAQLAELGRIADVTLTSLSRIV